MLSPLKALWIIALLAAFPLFAQETVEATEESGDEAAVEQSADTQEEAAVAEKKDEEKKDEEKKAAEETAEKKEEPIPAVEPATPVPTIAPEQQVTEQATEAIKTEEVVAEVKEEGDEKEEKKEEEKEPKKYNVGLTNVISQNINIDRPNFGYALSVAGSYTMPWELNLGASIGFAYNLGYARDSETVYDATPGETKKGVINSYAFDGIPLQIELSRRFVIPKAEIGITPVIGWSLPITSVMLWDVYTLRSTLSPSVTIDRTFKLMEGMTLAVAYTCAYAYNFAEYDVVVDKFTHEVLDTNVQMAVTNLLMVSWSFKGFSLKIGAGIESSIKYGELDQKTATEYSPRLQLWDQALIFQGAAGYSMKGFTEDDQFVFGLSFTTAGPQYENGNYAGFSNPTGESYPNLKGNNGVATIPFAGKYTKISATIGYNYSF